MEAICLKAIANKPEDRFQSMEEFEQALDDMLQGRQVEISVPDPETRVDPGVAVSEAADRKRADTATSSARSAKQPAWVWGVIGLLVLVIVGFTIRPMFSRRGPTFQNAHGNPAKAIDLSPQSVFREGDKNQDGLLGSRELPLHVIERADDDGDSFLSFEELENGYEKRGRALYNTPDEKPAPLNSLDELWPNGTPPGPGGPGFGRRPPPGPSRR
jgi:hypothetical protein